MHTDELYNYTTISICTKITGVTLLLDNLKDFTYINCCKFTVIIRNATTTTTKDNTLLSLHNVKGIMHGARRWGGGGKGLPPPPPYKNSAGDHVIM